MPLRYQRGYLRCVKRKSGPSQWDSLWRENVGGRRIRRTAVIGSIDEYPTEELAQVALNGFRVFACDIISTILVHETAIVTILEFRCQCHFWRLTSTAANNRTQLRDVCGTFLTFS